MERECGSNDSGGRGGGVSEEHVIADPSLDDECDGDGPDQHVYAPRFHRLCHNGRILRAKLKNVTPWSLHRDLCREIVEIYNESMGRIQMEEIAEALSMDRCVLRRKLTDGGVKIYGRPGRRKSIEEEMMARAAAAVQLTCKEGVADIEGEIGPPSLAVDTAQFVTAMDERRPSLSGASLMQEGSAMHEAPFPPVETDVEPAGAAGQGDVSTVREERSPEARMEVMDETVGTIFTAGDLVTHEGPIPRGARMDRIKRLDSNIQTLRRMVADLKRENGDKAARLSALDVELRRLIGEVNQAKREKEAWFQRASALQQDLMNKAADLANEKDIRLKAEEERDHLRQAVDDLRSSEGWRTNLWNAKADARRLEVELQQMKKDMQRERTELGDLKAQLELTAS